MQRGMGYRIPHVLATLIGHDDIGNGVDLPSRELFHRRCPKVRADLKFHQSGGLHLP